MKNIIAFLKKLFNTRYQKYLLNTLLIAAVVLIELGAVELILEMKPKNLISNNAIHPETYSFISVSIIIGWLGILIAYYAWAIHFYNINLGLTNEDWAKIKKKKEENKLLKMLGNEAELDEVNEPAQNPYKEETFGLPPGTVRGTIALSMLIGGFSLLILSQNPMMVEKAPQMEKYLEYFKTAFLMMIAFYFGSQSLKFLKPDNSTSSGQGSAPSGGKSTAADEVPATAKAAVPSRPATKAPVAETDPDGSPATAIRHGMLTEEKEATSPSEPLELPYPKDLNHLVSGIARFENNKKISNEQIATCAKEFGLEPALVHAVIKVESSGSGFLSDGRPKILFEGHIFWKLLKKKGMNPESYAAKHPDILYPSWTKQYYSKKYADEYIRLEKAALIDKDSAYQSASWGLFQIMGMNYAAAGYDTVSAFVEAQRESEYQHLQAFMRFITSQGLTDYLKNYNWREFARRYNGPGYEANEYHIKLEKAYADYSKANDPSIKVVLKRVKTDEKQTLGEFTVYNAERPIFTCKTLELPWKDNQRNISCIPPGKYKVQKRKSENYGNHFHVMDVKDRSWILIHSGNYYMDTKGCILVGTQYVDLNKDGFNDVANSKVTMQKLNTIMPDEFEMEIS